MRTEKIISVLLLNFLLVALGGTNVPAGQEKSATVPQEKDDISDEDREIIRQMGLLENLDLLNQEDVAFLNKYEEAESLSAEEVNHAHE